MIHVLAFARIRPGMMAQALAAYRVLVPQVLANEPGCLEYSPTADCNLDLANQELTPDLIVVTERWKSVEDFRAHLAGPAHVVEFRAAFKDCVEKVTLRITEDVL